MCLFPFFLSAETHWRTNLTQWVPNLKLVVGKAETPTKFAPVLNSEVKNGFDWLNKGVKETELAQSSYETLKGLQTFSRDRTEAGSVILQEFVEVAQGIKL